MKECKRCGCERKILIEKPHVFYQEDGVGATIKCICVPCLLNLLNLQDNRGNYNFTRAMEVMPKTVVKN